MNPVRSLPLRPLATIATLAAGLAASAQETPYELEKSGWFVRVGAYIQTGMSVSVSRKDVSGPLSPGVYDDGFVLADLNHGADGLTSNWGYVNNEQVTGGALQLSRINGLANPQSLGDFGNSNLYGPEVVVGFEFYRFEIHHHDARLGFEAAFRYGTYSGSDRGTETTTVTRDVARYDLGGVVPPLAPYVGLPNYAGPLIGYTPLSQTTTVAHGTSTVSSDLTADFYTARFGMWMTFPVTEKFRVSLSLGFSSIYGYGTASFKEVRTYDDISFPDTTRTASTHTGDWLPGFYLQPRVSYWFKDWMSVYVSAEYSHNGSLRMDGLDYQARMDFGSTFGASGGVQFSF